MNNAVIWEQKSNWPHSGSHVDHVALSKPYAKDRRIPLPDVESLSSVDQILVDESMVDSGVGMKSNQNQVNEVNLRKVQALEKSMEFLQREHKETLMALQSEVEKLKKENNELQFKIVMIQAGDDTQDLSFSTKKASDTQQISSKSQNKSLKTAQLENEIYELKAQLEEEQRKGKELQHLYDSQSKEVESKMKEPIQSDEDLFDLPALNLGSEFPNEIDIDGVRIQLNPLSIKFDGGTSSSRYPSLQECETIIKHILKSNMQLNKEIQTLKELPLKSPTSTNSKEKSHESMSSKTPILPPISAKNVGASRQPSDISLKSARNQPNNFNVSSCSNSLPYASKDTKSLPALRQTLGTKVAERKRKTEAIQKRRLEDLEKFSK